MVAIWIFFAGLNRTLKAHKMDWDTLKDSSQLITKHMRQMSMQGHTDQLSMGWNEDKLVSHSTLALNHSEAAFNTAWTLRTKFVVWPASCEDRIYIAVAITIFGELPFLGSFDFVLRFLQSWKCAGSIPGLPSVLPSRRSVS